jgi:hypothetical protein
VNRGLEPTYKIYRRLPDGSEEIAGAFFTLEEAKFRVQLTRASDLTPSPGEPYLISSGLNLSLCCLWPQDFELSNQVEERRCAKIEGKAP